MNSDMSPMVAAFAADLRWAADRLEKELDGFPLKGRHTRAGWAVLRLRMYADEAQAVAEGEDE